MPLDPVLTRFVDRWATGLAELFCAREDLVAVLVLELVAFLLLETLLLDLVDVLLLRFTSPEDLPVTPVVLPDSPTVEFDLLVVFLTLVDWRLLFTDLEPAVDLPTLLDTLRRLSLLLVFTERLSLETLAIDLLFLRL